VKIAWTRLAIDDREGIFDYIAADNPMAALAIDERVQSAIESLGRFTQMGRPGRVSGTRELVIANTSYIAAYQIEESSILILRVLHCAQLWPVDFES
jgi:addiction module RelE/StbE family toxin